MCTGLVTAKWVALHCVRRSEIAQKITNSIHHVIKKNPRGKPIGIDCCSLQPNEVVTTGKVLLRWNRLGAVHELTSFIQNVYTLNIQTQIILIDFFVLFCWRLKKKKDLAFSFLATQEAQRTRQKAKGLQKKT